MALDTVITGANLDAGGNVKVALSNTDAYVGAVRLMSENDDGTKTGVAYLKSPETSSDYRLRVGTDTVLFSDTFNATTQNTTNWSYTFVTLTAAQLGAGTVNFGNVQGTANTHGAFMRTFEYFPLIGTAPLAGEFSVGPFGTQIITDEVFLCGFGTPGAAVSPPIDGVWFKYTNAGWTGVLMYNNAATETGVIWDTVDTPVGEIHRFVIVVGEEVVEFWRDDVLLAELSVPGGQGAPFIQGSLPAFMQKYCTGTVSNTNTMRVSDVTVSLMDVASNKPWAHQMAVAGSMANVGQNGHTQGKTSLWTNNTAPTAIALTNTTAAFTGLGGIVAVLPTLTANTDGILINYTNPAATVNITGRNLIVTGVKIQGAVSVILAGGPVIYAYALAFGHTAVSLTTGETASFATNTTHAPRILPIGIESFPATAAVGTVGTEGSGTCILDLGSPICVRPGENVAVIARNIGVVTTTGAITNIVSIQGYWE